MKKLFHIVALTATMTLRSLGVSAQPEQFTTPDIYSQKPDIIDGTMNFFHRHVGQESCIFEQTNVRNTLGSAGVAVMNWQVPGKGTIYRGDVVLDVGMGEPVIIDKTSHIFYNLRQRDRGNMYDSIDMYVEAANSLVMSRFGLNEAHARDLAAELRLKCEQLQP